jgi:urease beta subunit
LLYAGAKKVRESLENTGMSLADIGHMTDRTTLTVTNQGNRPIQVGSHFHFFEVDSALQFERWKAYGMRLDIAPGTALRFEPGKAQTITLVRLEGDAEVAGFSAGARR